MKRPLERNSDDDMPSAYRTPAAILGRLLLAAIFLISPLANLIPNFKVTIVSMQKAGVPFATPLLVVAIAMLIAGSLSLIAGYKARWGAILLLVFLLPATYYFHAPWTAIDASEFSQQIIHFLKNVALMGAMLLVAVLGPGPGSIDGIRQ